MRGFFEHVTKQFQQDSAPDETAVPSSEPPVMLGDGLTEGTRPAVDPALYGISADDVGVGLEDIGGTSVHPWSAPVASSAGTSTGSGSSLLRSAAPRPKSQGSLYRSRARPDASEPDPGLRRAIQSAATHAGQVLKDLNASTPETRDAIVSRFAASMTGVLVPVNHLLRSAAPEDRERYKPDVEEVRTPIMDIQTWILARTPNHVMERSSAGIERMFDETLHLVGLKPLVKTGEGKLDLGERREAKSEGCGSFMTRLDEKKIDHLTSLRCDRLGGSGLGTSPLA